MAASTTLPATDLGFTRDRHYLSARVGYSRRALSFETRSFGSLLRMRAQKTVETKKFTASQVGIQFFAFGPWVPAFAGTSGIGVDLIPSPSYAPLKPAARARSSAARRTASSAA